MVVFISPFFDIGLGVSGACPGVSWLVGLAGPVVLLVSFLRRGLEAALAGALLAALGLAVGVAT